MNIMYLCLFPFLIGSMFFAPFVDVQLIFIDFICLIICLLKFMPKHQDSLVDICRKEIKREYGYDVFQEVGV